MESSSLPYDVLDLALDGVETSELCRNTMKLLASARRVIVVAGAGISVAAGIPDFRSSTGLFSTLKADTKFKPSGKALFDASVYKVTPSIFRANS
jgi:NAD-dependent histone deacetylase SIR2